MRIFPKTKLNFCHGDFLNDLDSLKIYIILIKSTVKYFWVEKDFMHFSKYGRE